MWLMSIKVTPQPTIKKPYTTRPSAEITVSTITQPKQIAAQESNK